jgi:hypothetical protein
MNDTATPVLPTLGGVAAAKPSDTNKRMTALIWGDWGVGKTTLAATAPGRKLWYSFDPDGTNSLAGLEQYEEITHYDLSGNSDAVLDLFKNETNPLNIKSALPLFDTFVFDSITNVVDKTLQRGIKTNRGATIERPSPAAYQTRNALAIRLVKNVMAATRLEKKHIIFIAHERTPYTDEEGNVVSITLALGGQLSAGIGIDFSEVWHVYQTDTANERRVVIRPHRKRKPAKTRMWIQSGQPEFTWRFNADEWGAALNKKYRMDTWFNMWNTAGHKLALPGTAEFDAVYKTTLQ